MLDIWVVEFGEISVEGGCGGGGCEIEELFGGVVGEVFGVDEEARGLWGRGVGGNGGGIDEDALGLVGSWFWRDGWRGGGDDGECGGLRAGGAFGDGVVADCRRG